MKKNEVSYSLTQRQIWGIAILLMVIIIGITCWRLLPFTDSEEAATPTAINWENNNAAEKGSETTTFNAASATAYTDNNPPHKDYLETEKPATKLFFFDPNTASLNDFIQLGLRPKVAQTIVNYRNKGGKFYKKEDFAKIYTLSQEDYQRLAPYINIKSYIPKPDYVKENTAGKSYNNNYPSKSNAPVAVNSCTQEQLMQLKGIGTGYANRIIKYRDILGGYVDIAQLKEVYGMTDSLYEAIKPYILIDKTHIKTIAINNATEEELYKHPYIRKMAKGIVAYRKDIGGFKHIEDFKQVPLINEEIYRKIVPYLSLNN
jgi:competence protein ComEA